MTTTRRVRFAGTASALLVPALLVSGCGGKDAAADPPASSASSTGTDPSGSSTPAVEPASGGLMDSATASVRAPKGWLVDVIVKDRTVIGQTASGLSLVALSVLDDYGRNYSLNQLAHLDVRTGSYTDPQILPVAEMAGLPAFHVHGKADGVRTYDAYGLQHDGHVVTVIFKLHESAEKRQQVIDSVLATLELK